MIRCKNIPIINKSIDKVNILNGDDKIKEIARIREDAERDYNSRMDNARREGLEKGMAKGRAEGMAKGRAEGKAEGKVEREAEIIAKMKAKGMTEAQIRELLE